MVKPLKQLEVNINWIQLPDLAGDFSVISSYFKSELEWAGKPPRHCSGNSSSACIVNHPNHVPKSLKSELLPTGLYLYPSFTSKLYDPIGPPNLISALVLALQQIANLHFRFSGPMVIGNHGGPGGVVPVPHVEVLENLGFFVNQITARHDFRHEF